MNVEKKRKWDDESVYMACRGVTVWSDDVWSDSWKGGVTHFTRGQIHTHTHDMDLVLGPWSGTCFNLCAQGMGSNYSHLGRGHGNEYR